MEALDCIQSRRSVRKFLAKDVTTETIGRILECGMAAPSAGNLQSWKFIVVKGQGTREKIAEACVQQYWIAQAPVVIVVCSDDAKLKSFYGKRGEQIYALHNAAAAAQNIILAAHALGLSSCWVGAFEEEMLSRVLEIPESARPQVVIPIGYAGEKPKEPVRHHLESLVDLESWGNKFNDVLVEVLEDYHVLVKRGVTKAQEVAKAIFKKLKGK